MPFLGDGTLSIGSIFAGHYEILAHLAEGSFGRVYKGRQKSTGQAVAIKVLRLRRGDKDRAVENHIARLRRETRLCAELSHPNIVRLIDSGEADDGMLFAVFEFVPGATLKDVLAREGALDPGETVHLMTQVLDALACAHERGVVHRDLKPENIMITKTGARRNALVLDFGLGGFSGSAAEWGLPQLTASRQLMGTVCYAAPEQLRGDPPSPRSDLYSWGLVFLECLTGELAVRAASAHEMLLKQLDPKPLPIPASVRNPRLRLLLQAVTAKQVEKRDVTIESLLRTLAALEPNESQVSRVVSEPERASAGERRQLTIVACSLTVTTSDGAALDLEEIDELLHTEHAAFAQLAAHARGRVASVLGDRMLLVFGYPHAREDDARRAARVALEIIAEARAAQTRLAAQRGLELEVRVGIHTGLVIVRESRHGVHGDFDLDGVTAQVATRLQELARPSEILASIDTQRLLRDTIRAEPVGQRRVAELPYALGVFRLTGERAPAEIRETIAAVRETPLTGRGPELSRLLDLWKGAAAGRGTAVLLTGEAGIGKSRLLRELRRRMADEEWVEARCLPEDQDTPLRPIADILLGLGESAESLLARHGFDVAQDFPPLAAALSLPTNQDLPRSRLSPDRQKEVALNTILRLVLKSAAERPLAIALEDLHWADPTTLELVDLLVREAGGADVGGAESLPRLLVVATARHGFTAPWVPDDVAVIQLGRLSPDDVEAMVQAGLPGGGSLSHRVIEEVVRRADGVPLFVEEVTRMLLESGAVPTREDQLAPGSATLAVPSTLRDLLNARLDALSPSARQTVQVAAVLGREFRAEMLRAASCEDESVLRQDLRELIDADIIYHRRSVRSEAYIFKHALVRDAAYETLLRPARQKLHRHVGNVLRNRFPEVERDRPEILAQHFQRGGEIETAVAYWKHAGDRAMARGAYVESTRLFERGLALLQELPDPHARKKHELGLTESLGTALFITLGFGAPEVEEKFGRALALCEMLGQDVPLRVLMGVWVTRIVRSDRDATAMLVAEIQRRADGSPDAVVKLTAHAWGGIRAFYAGDFPRARDEMTHATEYYYTEAYRSFVDAYGYDGAIETFAFLMWSSWILGFPARAREICTEMLANAEKTANPFAIAAALGFGANFARDRGDLDDAMMLTTRSIAHATEQKLHFWLGPALCTQGWARVERGDVEAGIAQIEQGLHIYETIGVRVTYDYHRSGLIEAHLKRGAAEDGLALVRDSLGRYGTLLDCFYEAELHRLEGELRSLLRDSAGAEASFRKALETAHRQQAKSFELRAATSLARLLRRQGRNADARALLAPIYGWFTEGFETRDLVGAKMLLDGSR